MLDNSSTAFLCFCRNAAKSLLIALFLTVTIFAQTDGHNPKLNLDDFEKEYVRIKKACTTIGYCRCHCTKKG